MPILVSATCKANNTPGLTLLTPYLHASPLMRLAASFGVASALLNHKSDWTRLMSRTTLPYICIWAHIEACTSVFVFGAGHARFLDLPTRVWLADTVVADWVWNVGNLVGSTEAIGPTLLVKAVCSPSM